MDIFMIICLFLYTCNLVLLLQLQEDLTVDDINKILNEIKQGKKPTPGPQ